jgi:hypothetical protein
MESVIGHPRMDSSVFLEIVNNLNSLIGKEPNTEFLGNKKRTKLTPKFTSGNEYKKLRRGIKVKPNTGRLITKDNKNELLN